MYVVLCGPAVIAVCPTVIATAIVTIMSVAAVFSVLTWLSVGIDEQAAPGGR